MLAVSPYFVIVASSLVGLCLTFKWSSFGDKEYTVVYETKTWINAEMYCEELGGGLAHADSEERNKFLISLTDQNSGLWLGASNAIDRKTWVWLNPLKPMTFKYWGPGQPDYADSENCLVFYKSSEGYKWNNLSCDMLLTQHQRGFICQRDLSSSGQNDNKEKCVNSCCILSDRCRQKCIPICL